MVFTAIGKTLNNNTDKKGFLKKQVETCFVLELAEKVITEMFGSDMAKHAKPLFLKNRTLTISCSGSVMAQEIRLNQAEIVEKINKKLPEKQVDRIRYLA